MFSFDGLIELRSMRPKMVHGRNSKIIETLDFSASLGDGIKDDAAEEGNDRTKKQAGR